jgi:hypothetical protein
VNALAHEAQHLAVDLGWRVLPVKEHGKEPLTRNGVKDATCDERTILTWWSRWPEANVGVATGFPGPSVLDIDDPSKAAFTLATLENAQTPESATARGRHLFYAGTTTGTITLGYGELRSVGSYVVVPPSVHPSGKVYVWLVEPRGRLLPPVPVELIGDKQSAGVGEAERVELVSHGERHSYLQDAAVRFLRGGITDVARLAQLLRAEYEANCEQTPPARADEFDSLAKWAAQTRIASRERNRIEHREGQETETPQLAPPPVAAPPSEHRAYIHRLAGLAADIEIGEVKRFGGRITDGMQITLSTGQVIEFARQSEVTMFGGWRRAVVGATDGTARPPALKEPQLLALYGSLCRIARTERYITEAEQHTETLREFLRLCEPIHGLTLANAATRFELVSALRSRDPFDPFDRNTLTSPALVIDANDGARYLCGGELWDFYRFKGAGLGPREFPGRMVMTGLEYTPVNGREAMPLDPERKRRTAHRILYRVPEGL